MSYIGKLVEVREYTESEIKLMTEVLENGHTSAIKDYMITRYENTNKWDKQELVERFNYRYKHFKERLENLERDTSSL